MSRNSESYELHLSPSQVPLASPGAQEQSTMSDLSTPDSGNDYQTPPPPGNEYHSSSGTGNSHFLPSSGTSKSSSQYHHQQHQPVIKNLSSGNGNGIGNTRRRLEVNCIRWPAAARANLVNGMSSLYAMLLVIVYVAFSFTELVTFPDHQLYLEKNGFFLYLYLLADFFFIYLLWFTLSSHKEPKVVENHRAHGSLAIRFGAFIFALGTLVYLTLELIHVMEYTINSKCSHKMLAANTLAALILVFLQTYTIFVYPRLNMHVCGPIDRFGTMHVVAVNIILWIRTLIKESLDEITESEEEAHRRAEITGHGHNHNEGCNVIGQRLIVAEQLKEECAPFHKDILGDSLVRSSPYLYPFVIEYALIGASVVFIMWRHVGKHPRSTGTTSFPRTIRVPHPGLFLRNGDWSHSGKGFSAGILIMLGAVLNLSLFFGLDGHNETEDEAEYFSKVANTTLNFCGILGLLFGLIQIQQLDPKDETDTDEDEALSTALDLTLLRFTAFFAYLYQTFTIITGAFNHHVALFPNELHIINGVVEIVQMTLQIMFILDLKQKVLPSELNDQKPGRQVTVFLFFLNLAQWLVFTFEIQKVRASVVEAEFYGLMPWVIIQRVTLPLTVFFRFHSAVVSIELWKEVYSSRASSSTQLALESSTGS